MPKRCSILGSATFRQGRRMRRSGLSLRPRGEMTGCRQKTMVITIPPTVKPTALAMAAPITPQPAPGMVKDRPNSVSVRVG